MRSLPLADPGTPVYRSPTGYLRWVAARQWPSLLRGMVFGITWMLCQALMPAAIGRAIDGIISHRRSELVTWSLVLLALGLVQAVAGVLRHRMAVYNYLSGAFRTIQLTVRQTGRLGATLPARMAAGEVVAIGNTDAGQIGNTLDITARAAGAVVALVVVGAILLHASVQLGLVVVIGAPVQLALVSLLIRPLHHRQQTYRDQQGKLTGRGADIVTGLRVLRGVGGEDGFADRYAEASQRLRGLGVQVASVESWLQSAEILLPGLFLVVVTWLGARQAVAHAITPGQLVAFCGYAAFLVLPLRTLTEAVDKFTRGHVAARRVIRLLAAEPEPPEPAHQAEAPAVPADLIDHESGVVLPAGRFVGLAADQAQEAVEVADRLGRYRAGRVSLGGVELDQLSRDTIRDLILVAENEARLFAGVLREELDPTGKADDGRLGGAVATACAEEIIDALPDGYATVIAGGGRDFSGGQQQRLRLVRALLADPPILILVEPTSAVDAHTEAQIAAGLGAARAGRSTLLITTSPLLLDRVDHVIYLHDGAVAAQGNHRDLLSRVPAYAATVMRGEQ